MHLKALMNNKTKAAGSSPQLMLQNYMLERLTDRELSVWLTSWWRYRFEPSTALSEMGVGQVTPISLICSAFYIKLSIFFLRQLNCYPSWTP